MKVALAFTLLLRFLFDCNTIFWKLLANGVSIADHGVIDRARSSLSRHLQSHSLYLSVCKILRHTIRLEESE